MSLILKCLYGACLLSILVFPLAILCWQEWKNQQQIARDKWEQEQQAGKQSQ